MKNKIYWIIFGVALCVALIYRVILPLPYTIGTDGVRFSQVDAYYDLRIADNLISTGYIPAYDYYLYPYNPTEIKYAYTIIPTVLAAVSQLGIPVDIVALIINPLLGLLALFLIYLLCKQLFNRNIALIALVIACLIPGEFLYRSAMGFTDHHVAEIVLLAASMLFYIKAGSNDSISTMLSVVFAGICAGLYLSLYPGGIIIYGMYAVYGLVIIFTKDSESLVNVIAKITVMFCVGIIVYLVLIKNADFYTCAVACAITFTLIATSLIRIYLNTRQKGWILYILFAIGIGFIIIMAIYVSDISYYLYKISYYVLWFTDTSTAEENPLLFYNNEFTLGQIWSNWGLLFFVFLVSLGSFIYRWVKYKDINETLIIVIGLVLLILTFAERRFAYYLAIPIAILSAYFLYSLYNVVKLKVKRAYIYGIVVVLFIALPMVTYSNNIAKPLKEYYTDDWHSAMVWMQDNTPEPLTNTDYYSYQTVNSKPEYYVLSWWDYGYWIIRDAHRVPLCHPGGTYRDLAARILTSKDDYLLLLKQNKVKYIIIDKEMIMNKLHPIQKYGNGAILDSLMMRLYYDGNIEGISDVYNNESVKIWEVD